MNIISNILQKLRGKIETTTVRGYVTEKHDISKYPKNVREWDGDEELETFINRRLKYGYKKGYVAPPDTEERWQKLLKDIEDRENGIS